MHLFPSVNPTDLNLPHSREKPRAIHIRIPVTLGFSSRAGLVFVNNLANEGMALDSYSGFHRTGQIWHSVEEL